MAKRICIVSAGCLSGGPRVEKEAQALAEAGYEVHVVLCHTLPWMAGWDADLARGRPWSYGALRWDERARKRTLTGISASALHRCARFRAALLPGAGVPDLALSDKVAALYRHARQRRADLFVAHNLAALPVAARLARECAAKLAFDAEDDHVGELADEPAHRFERRVRDAVQARYLPRCDYVSAVSPGVADALAGRYRIARPTAVHNVFPLGARESVDGARLEREGEGLSLYWYSQTLSLDRGVQDVILAAGRLRGEFQLHLRGEASPQVKAQLMRVAARAGVGQHIRFHPQVPPGELLSRTVEHDVGLALEHPVNENRMQSASNKLFFYMLAGIAIAATRTPGQQSIMAKAPHAGFSYRPGDSQALAQGLQRFIDDPSALAAAKVASSAAAEQHFCWDREREVLLARVAEVLV